MSFGETNEYIRGYERYYKIWVKRFHIKNKIDGTEEVLFEWYEKRCGQGIQKQTKTTTINEFIEQDKIATMIDSLAEKTK